MGGWSGASSAVVVLRPDEAASDDVRPGLVCLESDPGVDGITAIGLPTLPGAVIEAIRAAPLEDSLTIDGVVDRTDAVLRTKTLRFEQGGKLNWRFKPEGAEGFIVLAAERLILDSPDALLRLCPEPDLHGAAGGAGSEGQAFTFGSQPRDGQPGGAGGAGRTYRYPTLYIVLDELAFTPWAVLRLEADGLAGGNGGDGGAGGHGAQGTPGSNGSPFMPIQVLPSTGPTDGGPGGSGGAGGRGGDAGRGGDGATIIYALPESQRVLLAQIKASTAGGAPGVAGQPGAPGEGGPGGPAEGGGPIGLPAPGFGMPGAIGVPGYGQGIPIGFHHPIRPGPAGSAGPASVPGDPAEQGGSGRLYVIDRDNADLW